MSRGDDASRVGDGRFERVLPLAGVAAGVLLIGGLALTWGDPSSETSPAETFEYWADNRGRHQLSGLLLAPLIAFLVVFFGAGLRRALRSPDREDTAHGSAAFGGAIVAATAFALVGMLEGAAGNAAHEGQRQAVYTLSQLHSYDWLAWNASFAAMLLATGLGALRTGVLPGWLAWVTVAIGASLLTPLGLFGFFLLPVWLVAAGLALALRRA